MFNNMFPVFMLRWNVLLNIHNLAESCYFVDSFLPFSYCETYFSVWRIHDGKECGMWMFLWIWINTCIIHYISSTENFSYSKHILEYKNISLFIPLSNNFSVCIISWCFVFIRLCGCCCCRRSLRYCNINWNQIVEHIPLLKSNWFSLSHSHFISQFSKLCRQPNGPINSIIIYGFEPENDRLKIG